MKAGDPESDLPKGGDARVPLDVCYRIYWRVQGNKFDAALQIFRRVILIWWRINLTQGMCKFLNRSLPNCRKINRIGGGQHRFVIRGILMRRCILLLPSTHNARG